MDLFSQAEHDEAAQALLLSPQSSHLDQVELSMERLLPAMLRRGIITASLEAPGAPIEARKLEAACAPSHPIPPGPRKVSTEGPPALVPVQKKSGRPCSLRLWSAR